MYIFATSTLYINPDVTSQKIIFGRAGYSLQSFLVHYTSQYNLDSFKVDDS